MIVYKATDIENGKVYIGATTKSLNKRKNGHISTSKCNTPYLFPNALKNREDKFTWEVLRYCDTEDEMWEYEDYYINLYDSTNADKGYNMNGGGKSGKKSKETRKKIGLIKKKQWENGECNKEKISEGLRKGTKTWQKKCAEKRIEIICPTCGKKFSITNCEYGKRKFCSKECQIYPRNYMPGLNKANEVNAYRYNEKCEKIKEIVDEWKIKYKNEILECKLNKISPVLNLLCDMCNKSVGIKDIRSITKCYYGKYVYRKEFIKDIKNSY